MQFMENEYDRVPVFPFMINAATHIQKRNQSNYSTDGKDQRIPGVSLLPNPPILYPLLPQEGCLMAVCQEGYSGSGIATP